MGSKILLRSVIFDEFRETSAPPLGTDAGMLKRVPFLSFGNLGVTVNRVDKSCDILRVTFNFISNRVASTKCLA